MVVLRSGHSYYGRALSWPPAPLKKSRTKPRAASEPINLPSHALASSRRKCFDIAPPKARSTVEYQPNVRRAHPSRLNERRLSVNRLLFWTVTILFMAYVGHLLHCCFSQVLRRGEGICHPRKLASFPTNRENRNQHLFSIRLISRVSSCR